MAQKEEFSQLSVIDKHMVDWRARVTVLIKKPFKYSSNNRRTKYQKLILADEWGNCVDAVMYDSVIESYRDILQQDKTYIISNASIERADKQFSSFLTSKSDYSWTITMATSVKSAPSPARVTSLFDGRFSNYNSLDVGQHINIVVVIISGKPPRHTNTGKTIHEYVCIDEEFNEIILTLWNDDGVTEHTHSLMVDTNPAVALINFKVNKYHGIFSLNSNSKSFVVTKMDIPTLTEMEKWRTENITQIQQRLSIAGPADHKINTALNINLPEKTVSELMVAEMKQKYIIIVCAKIKDIPSSFTKDITTSFMYICCESCHTKAPAPVEFRNLYKCAKCNVLMFSVRRFRFGVNVVDATGELEVTMFGKYGENILNLNEDEFHHKYFPDGMIPKEDINSNLEGVLWRMTIYKNEYNRSGSMAVSYNVESMDQIQDQESHPEISSLGAAYTRECTISELLQSNTAGKYSLAVEAKFKDVPPSFMYICCEKCNRRTDVKVKTPFQCCSGYQHAIRRYRFCIQVHDSTGEITVIIAGKLGEIILDKTEDEFHIQYHPKWLVSLDEINKRLQGRSWKMTIVKQTIKMQGRTTTPYIAEYITPLESGVEEPEIELESEHTKSSELVRTTAPPNIDSVTTVRVKIEEVEDAKRIAAAEARRKTVRESESEIVRIDLEDDGINEEQNGKKTRARTSKRKTAG